MSKIHVETTINGEATEFLWHASLDFEARNKPLLAKLMSQSHETMSRMTSAVSSTPITRALSTPSPTCSGAVTRAQLAVASRNFQKGRWKMPATVIAVVRRLGMSHPRRDFREGRVGIIAVEFRALIPPFLEQGHLVRAQRIRLGRHALVLGLVRDHAQEARGVRPLEIDRRPTLTALVNPLEGGQPQPGLHVLARAVALEATLLEDRKDLLLEEGVVDLLGRIVRVLGLRGEQSPPPGQRLDACRG